MSTTFDNFSGATGAGPLDPAIAGAIDQGGPLWHKYRRACAESLYFFTKAVWCTIPAERNIMTLNCHGPMCKALEDDDARRLLIEWPRRHMKTTIASQAYPVWELVRKVVHYEDPNTRVGIYCASKINARRIWREVRWGFETNEFFQFLFPELIPNFSSNEIWNGDEGIVPRLYNPKEPTFDTLGGGAATSRHYDIIIEDDMITEQNFDSPAVVQDVLEYHRQTENLAEDLTSRIIVVGNRWSFMDLNHFIHTEEPDTTTITVSVHGPVWEGKYRCKNLSPAVEEALRSMTDPIWPERFDKEALGKLLMKQKARIFSAQYLNNPSDPDVVDFSLDWLKYYKVTQTTAGPAFRHGDGEHVLFKECNFYITWDPALGGKTAESRNAIVVTAMDSQGRVYLLKDYAVKEDPLKSMDKFIDYAKMYGPWMHTAGLEEVLFQKVLGKLLVERARDRKVWLPLRKLKTPPAQRKDQRIRAALTSYFEDGRVFIRDENTKFVEEYSSFGVEGAQRDLIDAFAYASQLWIRPANIEDRDDSEEVDPIKWKAEHRGVTGYGSALGGAKRV